MKIEPISYGIRDDNQFGMSLDYVGGGMWALRCRHERVTRKGDLIYEPQPSSRTKQFFKRTQFTLDEGIEMFKKFLIK